MPGEVVRAIISLVYEHGVTGSRSLLGAHEVDDGAASILAVVAFFAASVVQPDQAVFEMQRAVGVASVPVLTAVVRFVLTRACRVNSGRAQDC